MFYLSFLCNKLWKLFHCFPVCLAQGPHQKVILILKFPRTPWLAGSCVFYWGWSWNLQDHSSPGAGLEILDMLYVRLRNMPDVSAYSKRHQSVTCYIGKQWQCFLCECSVWWSIVILVCYIIKYPVALLEALANYSVCEWTLWLSWTELWTFVDILKNLFDRLHQKSDTFVKLKSLSSLINSACVYTIVNVS